MAGCSAEQAEAPVELPAVENAQVEVAMLSPDGYGPIRIGATPEEASHALEQPLLPNGDPINDCASYVLEPGVEPVAMRFLAIGGRLASITDHGSANVATPEGIAVGASVSEVRAAYPNVAEEPSEMDAPATTLTVWTTPGERGYRFHVFERRVTSITAGNESILLVEGCS